MALEIEHKYLVDHKLWNSVIADQQIKIIQGYLITEPSKTVRVRIAGEQGFMTIKGKTEVSRRLEFEYEIPREEAEQLLHLFCMNLIEKTRHIIQYEKKTWEVDVFEGANSGLIIAEIELESEDEAYLKPVWATQNITLDQRYFNSSLSKIPYSLW